MVVDGMNLLIGQNNAPSGKHWVSNNKSRWSGERKAWLISYDEWLALYRRGRAAENTEQAMPRTDEEAAAR